MAAEEERLPLVDVNADTAAQTWRLLQNAIDRSDFVALDLELSGLGHSKTRNAAPNLEERYKAMREVASTHGILSVGVACFNWEQRNGQAEEEDDDDGGCSRACKVEVFNIWLLSNEPYTIDPSSAKFLIQHGFDFNKHFAQGVRYTPAATELSPEVGSVKMLFLRLLSSSKPVVVHNGWVDLIFLYHSFYSALPPSLGSFMADLEEMFAGGIYDTKAIAQYLAAEHATFLEYIFRKRQSINIFDQSESRRHLKLHYATYDPGMSCVDHVTVAPPTPPPLEELLKIQMCHTFERYGYCHKSACEKCHSVPIAVAQEEHYAAIKAASTKRKREYRQQRKLQKKTKLEGADFTSAAEPIEDTVSDCTSTSVSEPALKEGDQAPPTSLAAVFERELATAKAKLHQEATPLGIQHRKPSFGHRAGFDAFMTGYTFACYCVMQSGEKTDHQTKMATDSSIEAATKDPSNSKQAEAKEKGKQASEVWWLTGLRGMRNQLGNRNKSLPMVVAKSHFAKASEGHRAAQERLKAWLADREQRAKEK